jgi:biotin operon repressor
MTQHGWVPETITLPELVHKNALIQAEEAGASPAARKALAHLAKRMNFDTKQVRYSQVGLADALGLKRETVNRAIRKLIELGLLIDHDRGLRRRKHNYELKLDWGFSKHLSSALWQLAQTPTEISPPPKRLSSASKYPRQRRQGDGQINLSAGNCNICHDWVEVGGGRAYKFQTEHRLFCSLCAQYGKAAAANGWPEDKPFPSRSGMQGLKQAWERGYKGHAWGPD